MPRCCIVGYKWVIVKDSVKFDFNDIISLYKKNDQLAYDITISIFDDIIVNKVIIYYYNILGALY